jgi:hypothetical protein
MAVLEKTGKFIDWLRRGEFVVRVVLALGVGKLIIASFSTRIPEAYRSAAWLLLSAAILWILLLVARLWHKRKEPTIQNITPTAAQNLQWHYIDAFYKNHGGPVLQEVEDAIRNEAQKQPSAADKERLLIRGMAATLLTGFFETTWHEIFGSQIRALERLNKGVATMDELRPFYEQGLEQRPQYPFESWFGYLKQQVLLRQDGHNISITVRGNDFLKWLVSSGKTAGDKRL